MDIRKVGVVGCGLMGNGIAQVSAQSGYDVLVREVSREFLDRGLKRIDQMLDRAVEKGKIAPADGEKTRANIKGTTDLGDLVDCDLIIEAVTEDREVKTALFEELDTLCPPGVIFTSNTSSIRIALLAENLARRDRVLGLHFFNPVPVMKLVEIVKPDVASEEAYRTCRTFVESLGKVPITCRDTTGFVVNRLLVPYLLDAIRTLEEGIATAEDIDTGMNLGCGYPMGPLTLLDFVGLDTTLAIAHIMHEQWGQPHFAPPKLLEEKVRAGELGRKSGKGFYDYTK
jgi:3-hydroxybutyryl-CoA dehydrogenase